MWRVVVVVVVVLYAGNGLHGAAKGEVESDVQNFRLGAESYRKGDYGKAVEHYTKSMVGNDPAVEMRAHYNVGNSKYMMAKKLEQSDPSGALSLYQQSLQYFRRAIELNEKDMDAKVNYELTDKKIRELSERLKNQPGQDKKQDKKDTAQDDKAQKDKDKEHSAKQGNQTEDKGREDRDKKGSESGLEPKHEQQSRAGKDNNQRPDKAPRDTAPRRAPGSMTKEEAEMLLEGLRYEQSGDVLKYKESQKTHSPVLKDW
ncbi:MAG: hypothetical protein HQL04_02445 [Nitrospirae bacterium]|nr:hypothetical protein [Nitrospirota bacterium]